MKSVNEVDFMADCAHAGQVDKIGVPYIEHVRAVAAGLAPFGDDLVFPVPSERLTYDHPTD